MKLLKLLLIAVTVLLASCRQYQPKPEDVFLFPDTNFSIKWNETEKFNFYISDKYSEGKTAKINYLQSMHLSSGSDSFEVRVEFIGKSESSKGDVYLIEFRHKIRQDNQWVKKPLIRKLVFFKGKPLEIEYEFLTLKICVKPRKKK